MTPSATEMRLRTALKELTSTTPLANPDHPRERPTVVPASKVSTVELHLGLRPDGDRPLPPRRGSRPVRLIVGTVSAVVAIAGFAVAVAYGPGSSDNGGSRVEIAPAQSARHVAATVELRSRDVPGWSGYRTPAPDPATTEKVARCLGIHNFHVSPPVASARSKDFDTDNLTLYAQSYTDVMATVAQAEKVTSLVRQSRFPSCYATLARNGITADLASYSHLSRLAVAVGPPPPGVNGSDAQTIFTSFSTQEVGAPGSEPFDMRVMLVRIGRVVTDVVVTAALTAGPYPVRLFNRLAVTISKRLARAT
jgi:hypothetical protein